MQYSYVQQLRRRARKAKLKAIFALLYRCSTPLLCAQDVLFYSIQIVKPKIMFELKRVLLRGRVHEFSFRGK